MKERMEKLAEFALSCVASEMEHEILFESCKEEESKDVEAIYHLVIEAYHRGIAEGIYNTLAVLDFESPKMDALKKYLSEVGGQTK